MSTSHTDAGAFADTLRARLNSGRATHAVSTALAGHLQRLAVSAAAAEAERDRRSTVELVEDVEVGDPTAETPLYVRSAVVLDRVAGRCGTDGGISREDLHQEAAEALIVDARSGFISEHFGGVVSAYANVSLRRRLTEMVLSQRPGAPAIPGRNRRKMREALTATTNAAGDYDMIAAVQYVRERFEWSLSTFWSVYAGMYAPVSQWHMASGPSSTMTYAETTPDPVAADALAAVETADEVRRMRNAAMLTRLESDVLDATYGFDGHLHTDDETGERLGITPRHVRRVRVSAVAKLREAAGVQPDTAATHAA